MTSATHRSAEEIGKTERGPRELPALGGQHGAGDLSYVDTVVQNGLRVLAVRKAAVPLVEVRLRIPFAGDHPAHPGIAEVLAETMLTGTARRDRIAIDTDLALIGGELGATVDPERLGLSASALSSGLPTLLDVFADVLSDATYADDEVARESARIVERLAVARTQPKVIAREALQHRRYGDHPSTREVPRADDVATVTPRQVRALHKAGVLPRGSTFVIVGDLDPERVVDDVRKAFAGWESENSAATMSELPAVSGDDLLLVDRPGAVQSQIRLSSQGLPRTDPRYPALQLANLAFGGYFSSRLVENIREDKGYTYSAHSGFEFTDSSATINVEADTANEVTAAALLETRYELGKLGLVVPTESEVESVRQYAIGSLLTSTSSQVGLANQLAALTGVGLGVDWLASHAERLAAVTADDVAAVAREFFAPPNFTGVVVGDSATLGSPLAALGGVAVTGEGGEAAS